MTQASRSSVRPLLTIAIPTFNRAKYLRESLSTLFDQLDAQPTVELLVSDNASSDETSAVIDEFQTRGLKLRYLRNEVNLGVDANFLRCFEQACGKYLWVLGDDDIVVPGGLNKILRMLEAADYALIYLCAYSFRSDYLTERQHDRFQRFAQIIQNGLPFIRKVGIMITFTSAIIVNKDRYRSAERPCLENFIGTNLMQLGWMLPVLGSGGTSLIIWEKLLAGRHSYAGAWSISKVFGENLNELLRTTLSANEDIAAVIVNSSLRDFFPNMLTVVRQSVMPPFNRAHFRESIEPLHKGNWRYWFYVFPVAFLPYWAARIWYVGTQLPNRAARLISSALALGYSHLRKELIWSSR
ncbi:MAG TPA: glycosyltransferase family 2 protein [Acidobacteriaceae bacterium]|nr:glycosyltransferase family 2 protein [Acidobacteriaceae bacterium]